MGYERVRPKVALSVRQPFAHMLVRGYKIVECRSWTTNYRGPIYIHASMKVEKEAMAYYRKVEKKHHSMKAWLRTGGIIGRVMLKSIYWDKYDRCYVWRLTSPKALKFRKLTGQRGLFNIT